VRTKKKIEREREYLFTIEGLLARYENEPTIRDLFVEGQSEVSILSELARKLCLDNLSVYSIDNVNVPSDLVRDDYGSGNRGRVVALAHALSQSLASGRASVYCLADKDFDEIFETVISCERLWFTDFSCFEAYLFDSAVIKWIFATYFSVDLSDAALSDILGVCRTLFFVRAAKKKLLNALSWVDPVDQFQLKSGRVLFDEKNFLLRLLHFQGQKAHADEFTELTRRMEGAAQSDFRNYIHKGDLSSIVCWFARERGASQHLCKTEVFNRVLLSQFSLERISEFALFRNLLSWAAT